MVSNKNLNFFGLFDSEYNIKNDFDIEKAYYNIGKRFLRNKGKTSHNDVGANCKEILKVNNASQITEIGKKQYNICVGKKQFIPSEYWCDSTNFDHPSLTTLFHPHFRLLFDLTVKNWNQKSKNLVVCCCGGSKPYIKNLKYRLFLKAAKYGYFDLCVSSIYPVFLYPIDTSTMYPHCFYDWPHDETETMEEIKDNIKAQYLAEFLSKFDYEKVIFIHFGKLKNVIDKLKLYNIKNVQIIDLLTDELIDELKVIFKGAWACRIVRAMPTRNHLIKALDKEDDNTLRKLFDYTEQGKKHRAEKLKKQRNIHDADINDILI